LAAPCAAVASGIHLRGQELQASRQQGGTHEQDDGQFDDGEPSNAAIKYAGFHAPISHKKGDMHTSDQPLAGQPASQKNGSD
jgi:hypothetical protein